VSPLRGATTPPHPARRANIRRSERLAGRSGRRVRPGTGMRWWWRPGARQPVRGRARPAARSRGRGARRCLSRPGWVRRGGARGEAVRGADAGVLRPAAELPAARCRERRAPRTGLASKRSRLGPISRKSGSVMAVPCSMESTPARTSCETQPVVAWAATLPPAACTAAAIASMAWPEYVGSAGPDGTPSTTGGKSAMTFTPAPAARQLGRRQLGQPPLRRPCGSSAGKYRPGGGRNRPAACNRGIPGPRSRLSTDPPGDPASRTRHTPKAAHPAYRPRRTGRHQIATHT
jgi:hypothetical protein